MKKTLITIAKIGGVALFAGAVIYGTQLVLKKMNEADDYEDDATYDTEANKENDDNEEKNGQSINLYEEKSRVSSTISARHQHAANLIREMLTDDVVEEENNNDVIVDIENENVENDEIEKVDFDEIDESLDKLLDEE